MKKQFNAVLFVKSVLVSLIILILTSFIWVPCSMVFLVAVCALPYSLGIFLFSGFGIILIFYVAILMGVSTYRKQKKRTV